MWATSTLCFIVTIGVAHVQLSGPLSWVCLSYGHSAPQQADERIINDAILLVICA